MVTIVASCPADAGFGNKNQALVAEKEMALQSSCPEARGCSKPVAVVVELWSMTYLTLDRTFIVVMAIVVYVVSL